MTNDLLNFYQHIPQHLNPDISFGFLNISWYSVMYLVAFGVVYLSVRYRFICGEWIDEIKKQKSKIKISNQNSKLLNDLLLDFLLYSFIGLIIGARLGEVLFYNFSYYMADPIRIISPFDPVTHKFIGIYGMSYHGGVIGVLIAAWIWARKNNINLLDWANFVIPAIPLGYFFGRLGNFINGELYGRVTEKWWGMYFSDDERDLRHPSQLYESFLEGILLFAILWPLRNSRMIKKYGVAIYLSGYAVARFTVEFFREPDGWIGSQTIGQFLSVLMLSAAMALFVFQYHKGWYNKGNSSPTTFSLAPKAQKINSESKE